MRRSTRHSVGGGSPFPSSFQSCINVTDLYARELNLRPLILHLPFDEEVNDVDLHGLSIRLRRNKSFVHTSFNRAPAPYPVDREPYLQRLDLSNGDARVDSLVASLCNSQDSDPRPGILVMLVQPPSSARKAVAAPQGAGVNPSAVTVRAVDISGANIEVFAESRPLTGILVKIGAPPSPGEGWNGVGDGQTSTLLPNGLYASVSDRLERSIVGAFCRRSVPDDVAEEILRVTLVRAIVEAICYEDVMAARDVELKQNSVSGSGNSSVVTSNGPSVGPPGGPQSLSLLPLSRNDPMANERDKRFVSINTQDLALCPAVLLPALLSLRFMKHWDKEEGPNEFIHDDSHRECPCVKKVRTLMAPATIGSGSVPLFGPNGTSESNSGSELGPSTSEFYQFFTLNTKRVKGIVDQQLNKLVPEAPSTSAYAFCFPSEISEGAAEAVSQAAEDDALGAERSRKRQVAVQTIALSDTARPVSSSRKRRPGVGDAYHDAEVA